MNQINLITPPDKIRNDSLSILLISPDKSLQNHLQKKILPDLNKELNLYYFYQQPNTEQNINWLLDVFELCDYCIIDVDNTDMYLRDLLSYFMAKSKTYWLTKTENLVYTYISKNRIYDLSFLKQTGD